MLPESFYRCMSAGSNLKFCVPASSVIGYSIAIKINNVNHLAAFNITGANYKRNTIIVLLYIRTYVPCLNIVTQYSYPFY